MDVSIRVVGNHSMLGGVLVGSAVFLVAAMVLLTVGIDEHLAGTVAGVAAVAGLWGVGLVPVITRG